MNYVNFSKFNPFDIPAIPLSMRIEVMKNDLIQLCSINEAEIWPNNIEYSLFWARVHDVDLFNNKMKVVLDDTYSNLNFIVGDVIRDISIDCIYCMFPHDYALDKMQSDIRRIKYLLNDLSKKK